MQNELLHPGVVMYVNCVVCDEGRDERYGVLLKEASSEEAHRTNSNNNHTGLSKYMIYILRIKPSVM